jgi:hypothetical protein
MSQDHTALAFWQYGWWAFYVRVFLYFYRNEVISFQALKYDKNCLLMPCNLRCQPVLAQSDWVEIGIVRLVT